MDEPQALNLPSFFSLKDELDKDASALWHKFRTWSVRYPKLGFEERGGTEELVSELGFDLKISHS